MSPWQHDALAHALAEYPKEACGLVLNVDGVEIYFPCRNVAENQDDFVLSPEDYAEAEDQGEVIAVFHSHPNAPSRPSQADLVGCENSRLPWYIVSIPGNFWHVFSPSGFTLGYTGRHFAHGVLDCYSLIRDWYREEVGAVLPDFERGVQWWLRGGNLYAENFEKAGFRRLPEDAELKYGDVLVMQIRSDVANHAGIYLGHDLILHHMMQRLSAREPYGGWLKKCTVMALRYKNA